MLIMLNVSNINFDGNWKVPFIKSVRGITGMGLREAKDFVEDVVDSGKRVVELQTDYSCDSIRSSIEILEDLGIIIGSDRSNIEHNLQKLVIDALYIKDYKLMKAMVNILETEF